MSSHRYKFCRLCRGERGRGIVRSSSGREKARSHIWCHGRSCRYGYVGGVGRGGGRGRVERSM